MILKNQLNQKEQLMIFGLIIKVNRLKQNMSQQALCEGICVPSYLSKIENGETVPSLEMIVHLFNSLGIAYQDDESYLNTMKEKIEQFYDELNFGGFLLSEQLYKELEAQEELLIHSPLVVDYYLMKFAYYCGTSSHGHFKLAKKMVCSVLNQLNPIQKHRYYFYEGVNALLLGDDLDRVKSYLLQANTFYVSANGLNFLGIVAFKQKSYFEAIQYVQESNRVNIHEGNLMAMPWGYEVLGLFSYRLGSFEVGMELLQKAKTYALKLGRHDLMMTPLFGMGYMCFQEKHYEKALSYFNEAKEIQDKYNYDWAELNVLNLLWHEANKRVKNNHYVLEDVLKATSEKVEIALKILYFGYHPSDEVFKMEMLFQQFKQIPMLNLYLDEMIRNTMYDYYISVRKYKEAMML